MVSKFRQSTRLMIQQTLRSGFARSVAMLTGGTLVAQAMTVAVSPVLTRLYGPAETGQLGLYLSFVGFATVVLSLKYETAIVTAKETRHAALLTILAIVLTIPTTLLAGSVFSWLVRNSLLGFSDVPRYASVVLYPALLSTGFFMALRYWLVRSENFKEISQVSVVQNGVRSVVQVGIGLVAPGAMSLLLGDLLGRLAGLGRMTRASVATMRKTVGPLSLLDLKTVTKSYSRFPLLTLPSSILDVLALSLPLPLIAQYYGFEAAGQFTLVQRVVTAPMGLIGTSIADVVHARLAALARSNPRQARALFLRTSGGLLLLGLVPCAVLVQFGPLLFSLVFGAGWDQAGVMARILAPWALAQFVVSPVSRVAFVYDGQGTKLIYDIAAVLTVIVVLTVAGSSKLTLPSAMTWLSACRAVSYGLYFALLLRLVLRGHVSD